MTPFYTLHHQVRRLDEELCGNSRKYSTEDVLFSDSGKRIVLGESIAEGGEGSVFTAHAASASPLVAKLYHPTQRIRWREQKLRLMCSLPIRPSVMSGLISPASSAMLSVTISPVSIIAICVHAPPRGIWRVVFINTSRIWSRTAEEIIPCTGSFCMTDPARPQSDGTDDTQHLYGLRDSLSGGS